MDTLTVEINGVVYNDLVFNEQTGYYEKEIEAPNVGGIYPVNVTYVDYAGNIYTASTSLQVLAEQKAKTLPTKFIGYFLDKDDFHIKDVVPLQDYELIIDEETNANSTFVVMRKINASDEDIVIVKEGNNIVYYGVIESPQNENGGNKFTFTAKYITNIFDRTILLKNEALISSTGIEDFIAYTIKDQFTQNADDPFLNKTYIDIEVLTHTPVQKSVDTEHGIYNFHTYMTNATQNYNINYIFNVVNGRLKLTIEKQTEDASILDCTIPEITGYLEQFELNYTAKVIVTSESGAAPYILYLKNDRTTTTNKNDPNRVKGNVVTTYTELDEDRAQTALNIMNGNRYNHLVQFKINLLSKLYDVENWHVGKPFKMKTRNGEILDTYISNITRKRGQSFIKIMTGKIRVDFIDKLKQGGKQ